MVKKSKMKFRVTYNAPVTLTFSLLAAIILLLDTTVFKHHLISAVFVAPGCQGSAVAFNWQSGIDYFKLFSHVLGHADWNHLFANLAFILLLGPILEEKYGSTILLTMILVTSFVTGIINACLIPSRLMGSSGIAFMMILLASFSTMSRHEIPLSFLLILALYVGREMFSLNHSADVATFAHIAGGICGSMFGFLAAPRRKPSSGTASKTAKASKAKKADDIPPLEPLAEDFIPVENLEPVIDDNLTVEKIAELASDENSPRFKK